MLGAGLVLVALFVAGMFMLRSQPTTTSAFPVTTPKSKSTSHTRHPKKPSAPASHHHSAKPAPAAAKPIITLTGNNVPAGILTYSVSGGPLQVSLDFSGPCWVEVWKNGISRNPSGFTYAAGQTLNVSSSSSVEFWAGTRLFSLTVDHQAVSLPDPSDRVVHVTFVRS